MLAAPATAYAWLDLRSPERYAAQVAAEADRAGAGGRWVLLPSLNEIALAAFVRRRLETGFLVRALDNLLAAAVLGARELVDRGIEADLGLKASAEYEVGPMLCDLTLLGRLGVARAELHGWLEERRASWYAAQPRAGVRTQLRRHFSASVVPLELAFPRATAAVYAAPPTVLAGVAVSHGEPHALAAHLEGSGLRVSAA